MKEEVKEVLNSDRAEYDRLYGADDTYWMLQDNVTQLQWRQETAEPFRQVSEWSYPYAVYNGQYDFFLPYGSKEAFAENKIVVLWSETLPTLLLAESEERFDEIFARFLEQREAYGFEEVQVMKTELMEKAKEKLGMQ